MNESLCHEGVNDECICVCALSVDDSSPMKR